MCELSRLFENHDDDENLTNDQNVIPAAAAVPLVIILHEPYY